MGSFEVRETGTIGLGGRSKLFLQQLGCSYRRHMFYSLGRYQYQSNQYREFVQFSAFSMDIVVVASVSYYYISVRKSRVVELIPH